MKILWHSNHPAAGTGYGQQTALFVPLLAAAGHEVAVSAFYGQHGWICEWNGAKIYPGGAHAYGNDIILRHAGDHFGGNILDGLIVTLVDVWVLNPAELTRANVACWTPVDHKPAPPRVVTFLEASGASPIAMSRFGEKALTEAGLSPLYVPHGIDTSVFAPRDRREARASLGFPQDCFLVGLVAANKGYPSRKAIPEALTAFAEFRADHDDAFLYLHTEPHGIVNGVNVAEILAALDIPTTAVKFTDPYRYAVGVSPDFLASAYSAMDVLLNPSFGEGFGIPLIEAQACGTPVIVSDWTSMPELCGAGWRVGGQKTWSLQGAWWLNPNVNAIVQALESAREWAGDAKVRKTAREFALNYDARRVLEEYWLPALAQIETRMGAPALPELVEVAS